MSICAMNRKTSSLLALSAALVMALSMLLSAVPLSFGQLPLPAGVPRGDVLVIENHWGTYENPNNWNPIAAPPVGPGSRAPGGSGYQQLCKAFLWYINTSNSMLIPWIAAEPPIYSPDFTSLIVKLRDGVYWNDGKPLTAEDVAFTLKYLKEAPAPIGTNEKASVKDARALDKTTVLIELQSPNPRWHYFYAVIIYGAGGILPKHVWEGKDPQKFENNPPVCAGPYNLRAVDPAGNWFLWERFDNWWGSKVFGVVPAPKYVLYINHGPDEAKALAMTKHELDALRTLLPEQAELVIKNNPYLKGWRASAPYAWPLDPCVKGIAFQTKTPPLDKREVRWALAYAIDYRVVYRAFVGIDKSTPTPAALPVIPHAADIETYYIPLLDVLKQYGYDPQLVLDIARENNAWWVEKYPVLGWWKQDLSKAEQLLTQQGFTRGPDGKWRLPDGTPWTLEIKTTSGFEMESQRIAFLVADQWRAFGIDVKVTPLESGPFSTSYSVGDFQVGTFWPGCSQILDLYANWFNRWSSKYWVQKKGEGGHGTGWNTADAPIKELDAIVDELERTAPDTPRAFELYREALKIWIRDLPWLGFFPTPFYTFQDGYAWDNWPTFPENYYMDPVSWWSQHLFVILKVKPTGRAPTKDAIMTPAPLRVPNTPLVKIATAAEWESLVRGPPPPTTPGVTVTLERTVTQRVTELRTQVVTQPVTVTQAVTDVGLLSGVAAGVGVVLLIVGIAVGRALGRRRPAAQ
jgi:peptide/nickel transport system substrate-binding protein